MQWSARWSQHWAIDRATLVLTLSHQNAPHAEQVDRARAAERVFNQALRELSDIEEEVIRASDLWQVWHDDAQRGLKEARERLEDLGR